MFILEARHQWLLKQRHIKVVGASFSGHFLWAGMTCKHVSAIYYVWNVGIASAMNHRKQWLITYRKQRAVVSC